MTSLVIPQRLVDLLAQPVNEAQALVTLDLASAVVRSYCGWRLDRATETLRVEGQGHPRLLLPTLELHDVFDVRINGEPVDGWEWSAAGVLRGPRWTGLIEVDCAHGYDPIPGDIQAVVLQAAKRVVINPGGLRDLTLPTGVREGYALPPSGEATDLTLTAAERRILDRHRLAP